MPDRTHELISLLLNLSHYSDRSMLLQAFSQAMQARWPGLTFAYAADPPQNAASVLPLNVGKQRYGCIAIHGDTAALSVKEQQLLGNGAQMLALHLERLEQQALVQKHRQLKEQAAEQARKLELAMEGAKFGAWDLSRAKRTVVYDRVWEDILGYAPEEVEHSLAFWRSHTHPDDQAGTFAALDALLAGEAPLFLSEHRLESRSGEWVWVMARGSVAQRNRDGSPARFSGIIADISDRKMAEEALAAARATAEEATRAKSAFLATMSHEIRTPLNALLGMLQLLEGTALDSEQLGFAQLATQSCKRLTNLLSDLLDLSRIESGRLKVTEHPFNLHEMIREVEGLYRPAAELGGVRLIASCDSSVPGSLLGDDQYLRQILCNLLGNAVKFTPSGSITLEVSSLRGAVPGQCRILFSIADTGIGIPADKLDSLLQPFARNDVGIATQQLLEAGLGLSIVKNLVLLLGGSMTVESQEGEGTTVYISMSFRYHDQPGGDHAVEPEALSRPYLHGKALVVEDEPVNQIVARQLLSLCGIEPHVVATGEQALEALRREDFGFILMDIQLPALSGLDVTRIIRNSPEFKPKADIPIVALTAYAMANDRETFLTAGMNDYLAKPVELDTLRETLERLLNKDLVN